jgi:hypothetical protein
LSDRLVGYRGIPPRLSPPTAAADAFPQAIER